MKFNAPGPEIINGRLAMIGILAAAVNESAHAETIVQQVPHVPVRIVALCLLVTYSSLKPILKGAKSEAFGEKLEVIMQLAVLHMHGSCLNLQVL